MDHGLSKCVLSDFWRPTRATAGAAQETVCGTIHPKLPAGSNSTLLSFLQQFLKIRPPSTPSIEVKGRRPQPPAPPPPAPKSPPPSTLSRRTTRTHPQPRHPPALSPTPYTPPSEATVPAHSSSHGTATLHRPTTHPLPRNFQEVDTLRLNFSRGSRPRSFVRFRRVKDHGSCVFFHWEVAASLNGKSMERDRSAPRRDARRKAAPSSGDVPIGRVLRQALTVLAVYLRGIPISCRRCPSGQSGRPGT
jgi:hypothetical protein